MKLPEIQITSRLIPAKGQLSVHLGGGRGKSQVIYSWLARKPERFLFLSIFFFSLIRLAVAPSFGLGVDEAHYVLYARYLDLSYVDHPPLVGWIHALIYYSLGTNEFLVRLPAIVLFALLSYLSYNFMLQVSHSPPISLLGVLALNSSFLLNALSVMLLPDSLFLVLTLLLMPVIIKIVESGERKYFIYLGILLGLAGLAKYTAVLLIPPLLIYLFMKKRTDLLISKYLLMAAGMAILCVTPVIYWNLQNQWVSFGYQGSRMAGSSAMSFQNFFLSLLAQFGSYSPFLFLIAFYGFFKAFRSANDWIRLALYFGGTILIFFCYPALYDPVLPHWNSLFYLLFIPIGVYFLCQEASRRKKIFLKFSLGFSLVVTLLLYVEVAAKFFTFPDFQSPFQDIYGWAEISKEANTLLKENPQSLKALAVTNWTMGSRMMYYSLPYQNEVFVIDRRFDQFDFWQKNSPHGHDLLFVNTHFANEDISQKFKCGEVRAAKKIDILLNGGKVNQIEYVWCKNYQGMKNEKP